VAVVLNAVKAAVEVPDLLVADVPVYVVMKKLRRDDAVEEPLAAELPR
jgi:hypothetical protein